MPCDGIFCFQSGRIDSQLCRYPVDEESFEILNRPANLTVTVFNALALAGSRAELTVDEYGRRYDAPCWANLRLRYDVW